MAISITKPTVGGSEDTWGNQINTALDTIVDAVNGTSGTVAPDHSTLTINGTDVTATAAELNIMDGVTATTAELNILDGVTAGATELNIMDGVTATTAELNIMDGVTATTAELNIMDGVTATTAELNIMDGVTATAAELNIMDGVTATTAELNIMDGVTATAAELNKLDGVTATTAELNYTDGVTSNIQTQLDAEAPTSRTITAGSGLSGGGSLAANRTISHADTSSQASVNNSGNTFIQDITLDTYGHITGIVSAAASGLSVTASDFTGTDGYIKFSNNFMIQWGQIDPSSGTQAVSFSPAFGSNVVWASAQLIDSSQNYQSTAINPSYTTSGMTIYSDNDTNLKLWWIAMGI